MPINQGILDTDFTSMDFFLSYRIHKDRFAYVFFMLVTDILV